MMEVDIDQLRIITNLLFDHLAEAGIKTVDIPHDYYWNLLEEEMYEPYEKPTSFNMGQLSDDWNEVTKILNPDHEPIGYAFVWLAAILRAVGEVVVA